MSDLSIAVFILLPVLLISMSIHEMMHAYTADWLGDDTARAHGRVSINPLRHIDPFFTVALPVILFISGSPILFAAAKPVQVNFSRLRHGEFGGAIVGVIGPLTNLAIAIVAALIFNVSDLTLGTAAYEFFKITIMLNIGLFVFNMIPWPPLDGSRLLYAFAPRGLQEVMRSIEGFGMMGLAVFILIFYQLQGPISDLMLKLIDFLAPTLVL